MVFKLSPFGEIKTDFHQDNERHLLLLRQSYFLAGFQLLALTFSALARF